MLRRPRAEEGDEDLLKMQQEFLKKKQTEPPAAKCVRFSQTTETRQKESYHHKCESFSEPIIGENEDEFPKKEEAKSNFGWCSLPIYQVTERQTNRISDIQNSHGFSHEKAKSTTLKIDESASKGTKKQSLFAQRMAAKKTKQVPMQNEDTSSVVKMETNFVSSENFPENDEKLAQMSEAEILEEQRLLIERLDAKTVEFVKSLKSKKLSDGKEVEESDHLVAVTSQEASKLNPFTGDISTADPFAAAETEDVSDENNGEFIWATDLPEPDPNKSYSVRFDLLGNFVTDVHLPTHMGLHHHGQEPEVPGYTIEELFMLCKSANIQQKLLALKTLSGICSNARKAQFVQQLDSNVLDHLLESGFAMLARLMLDQSNLNLICQAVQSLWSILYSPASESVQEVCNLCSSNLRNKFVTAMSRNFKINQEDDAESVMKQDLIYGLVKTNLLNRLRYILEVVKPPPETCVTILDIVCKFATHSQTLAKSVFECPRLVNYIVEEFLSLSRSFDLVTFKALNLLSRLVASQFETALHLIAIPTFTKFLMFCIGDDSDERSTTDNDVTNVSLLVKSESWQLWEVLTTYNLLMDHIITLTSLIILRINRFQLIELPKCSDADLRFLIHYFHFCSQLLRNFIQSKEKVLHCYAVDIIEITYILLNKWTNELSDEIQHFCHPIHLACISSLWKLIFTAFSDNAFCLSSGKDLFEKLDLLRSFGVWSTGMGNLQLDKLLEKWPHNLTNSDSIIDTYFCLNIEKCQFYSLDFANNYLQLVNLFLNKRSSDFRREHAEFAKSVFEVLSKFLSQFMKMNFYVPEGSSEHRCGYHVFALPVQLVYQSLCLLKTTEEYYKILPSEVKYSFLSVCLQCISSVPPGNGELIQKLLQNFLFNSKFYNQQFEHLSHKLSQISIRDFPNNASEQRSFPGNEEVLKSAEMLFMWKLRNIMRENSCYNVDKYLILNWSSSTALNGPLLPEDWLFLPILDETSENDESCEDSQNVEDPHNMSKLQKVQTCLNFITLLLSELQSIDYLMSADLIFVRLMHVFMMGNEVFMDKSVENLMQYLFKRLCGSVSLPNDCAGLTSFHDYYMSFLEYFEAESFGHVLFSNFLLLPMCARFSPRYRSAVWIEHTAVFKVLRMEKEQLLFPLSWLCEGEESERGDGRRKIPDEEVRRAQSVCLSGDILDKCPILKHVASAYNTKTRLASTGTTNKTVTNNFE